MPHKVTQSAQKNICGLAPVFASGHSGHSFEENVAFMA